MRRSLLFGACILIIACSPDPNTYIDHLQGYWEIDQVILSDGSERTYNYNDTIDYIEITDSMIGYRKKMKPNFNGTFEASKDATKFKLKVEGDSLNIYYETQNSIWKETVLHANESSLKIINQNKDVYLYRVYEPILLDQ